MNSTTGAYAEITAGAGAVHSTTGAGAAITAEAAMSSTIGAGAATTAGAVRLFSTNLSQMRVPWKSVS